MCGLKRGLAVTEMQSQQKCKRSGLEYLRGPRAVEGASRHIAMDGSLPATACSLLQAWFASRRRRAPSAVQPRSTSRSGGRLPPDHLQSVSQCYTRPTRTTGHTRSRNTRGITHEACCAFSGKGINTDKSAVVRGASVGTPTHGPANAGSPTDGGEVSMRGKGCVGPPLRRVHLSCRLHLSTRSPALLRPRSQPCLPPP